MHTETIKQKNNHLNKGFIALITTMILSAVIMIIIFTANTSSFFARFDALNSEFKRVSLGLSEACTNTGLLKLAQNYNYTGDETISVGSANCKIQPITSPIINYDDSGNEKSKIITIKTSSEYPPVNGSWSTNQIKATIQNPDYFSLASPPICNSFTIAPGGLPPAQINAGQTISLNWSLTNAASFSVKRYTNSNPPYSLASCSGLSGPCTDTPPESATYVGIATATNGLQTQCPAVSIYVKPIVGDCADVVMMLDRTSGFINDPANPNNAQNEHDAAFSLLDLYNTVFPHPQIGIGSFGAVDSAPFTAPNSSTASVPIIGRLTTNYGNKAGPGTVGPFNPVKSSTTAGLLWTSQVNADKGRAPEIPIPAYATSSTIGQKQGYYNFGFNTNASNTIPANATISGVEVTINGKISANPTQTKNITAISGEGNYKSWNPNTGTNNATNRIAAVSTSGGTYLRMPSYSAVNNSNTFIFSNTNIPENSTINSVTLYATADTTGGTSNIQLRIENGTGGTNHKEDTVGFPTGHSITNTTFATSPSNLNWQMTTNPLTGLMWTTTEVNAWTTKFGVVRNNSTAGIPQVDQIYVVVNYTPPPINVDLSWDNGASWTTNGVKAIPLTTSNSSITVGDSSDTNPLWGRASWANTDFNNASLLLRLTNNLTTGNTVSIDYVNIKVDYTSTTGLYALTDTITGNNSSVGTHLDNALNVGSTEIQKSSKEKVLVLVSDGEINPDDSGSNINGPLHTAVRTAATNAKNAGVKIFTIDYGDNGKNGQTLMGQVATPDNAIANIVASTGAKITSNVATITTTADHNLNVGQAVKISGVTNPIFNSASGKFFLITSVPTSKTFTYTLTGANTTSGGGLVLSPHFFIPTSGSPASMTPIFSAIGYNVCPALSTPSSPNPIPNSIPNIPLAIPVTIGSWEEVISVP